MPSSVDLGTPNNPINPEINCNLKDVSVGEDNIQACLCRSPFCNDLSLDSNKHKSFESTRQVPFQRQPFVEEKDSTREKTHSASITVNRGFFTD